MKKQMKQEMINNHDDHWGGDPCPLPDGIMGFILILGLIVLLTTFIFTR